jgi:CRP-like cAMP-binding protein
MAKAKLDADAILDEAAKQLEARYAEIQDEIKPLREEEKTVAEALHRLVGSYPSGYAGHVRPMATPAAAARRTRTTLSEDERTAAILEFVNAAGAEGTTNADIGNHLGISAATVAKTVDAMIESGAITTNGKTRRARRLLAAA